MNSIHLKPVFDSIDLNNLNSKQMASLLPAIIETHDSNLASELLKKYAAYKDFEPEILALLLTPETSLQQKRSMLENLISDTENIDDENVISLSNVLGRIGAYGFSFPKWRFVTQGFDGRCLMERAGYKKLQRDTDILNPDLPKSDPARDKYGVGFFRQEGSEYIEFRRAYMLYADLNSQKNFAIIIRNSSYFFGRDRIPAPCFVCFSDITKDDILNISDQSFLDNSKFLPWRKAFSDSKVPQTMPKRVSMVTNALEFIGRMDAGFSRWLAHEGKKDLEAYITYSLDHQKDRIVPPFFLGEVSPFMPPWFPRNVISAKPDLTECHLQRLTLLSSAHGDFPCKPAVPLAHMVGAAPVPPNPFNSGPT